MEEIQFPYKCIGNVVCIVYYNFVNHGHMTTRRAATLCQVDDRFIIMSGRQIGTSKSEVFVNSLILGYSEIINTCKLNTEIITRMRNICSNHNIRVEIDHTNLLSSNIGMLKDVKFKYFAFLLHSIDTEFSGMGITFPQSFFEELDAVVNKLLLSNVGFYACKIRKILSFNQWDTRSVEFEYAVSLYVNEVCGYDSFCKSYGLVLMDFGSLGSEYGYDFTTIHIMERCFHNLYDSITKEDRHHDRYVETYVNLLIECIYALSVMHRDGGIIHNDTHIRNIVMANRYGDTEIEDFGCKFKFIAKYRPKIIDFDLCKFKHGIYVKGIKMISTTLIDDYKGEPYVSNVDTAEANLSFARYALADIMGFISNYKQTGGFNPETNPPVSNVIDKLFSLCGDYDELIKKPNQEYTLPGEYILRAYMSLT